MQCEFISLNPCVEESSDERPYYSQTPFLNALKKALRVSEDYPSSYVIGADTVIEFSGSSIGKPKDADDAVEILKKLSGKRHSVITAVALVHRKNGLRCVFADLSIVAMKELDESLIRKYMDSTNVLDKAGAYAIQENGSMIISGIEGSYDNIVGLPSEKLKIALDAHCR